VLLHGDFEARNILHATDGLVAIDSPAAVGDPGYDAASWVLSEADCSADSLPIQATQLAAALGYPKRRIWTWAWPLAVDNLLGKLHEPGWSQERIRHALLVARSVASVAAADWRSALR
jgi:streptomycin 6-kinase